MTEPDYKAMWEEVQRQVTAFSNPTYPCVPVVTVADLAAIEKKHTPAPQVTSLRLSVTVHYDDRTTRHHESYFRAEADSTECIDIPETNARLEVRWGKDS